MEAFVSQDKVVAMVSRTGRELQRYRKGRRQVVGCIPYRYKNDVQTSLESLEELQVLIITSKKGKAMLFPKGGWELDESKKEAAVRETIEEAGVRGIVEEKLGKWSFKSKTYDTFYEGYMFPLLVQDQLEFWPEQHVRQRIWMSISEAKEVCQHWWMKEALERLVNRLTAQKYGRVKQVVGSVHSIEDGKFDLSMG
ncbi:PREDICTED: nudix hydrolase 18, mitochondrial-like [Lupinus angustifolius]|uniref:nudix hydrolase 18, mitochondrial-like n=1 Tax=Lupinus angustifolius TaxID=3871 RepID=UPI00092EAFF1|nr:PREDICTED: nudix hydrolase 18, mitochondrial-like [Lupinus angustifolius]